MHDIDPPSCCKELRPHNNGSDFYMCAGFGETQAAGNHVFHSAYPGSVARMGYTASSFAGFINSQDHSKSTHRETIAPLGIEKQPHPG